MAGVDEYDVDANANMDIGGVNVAENCPPSGINNAIRQMAADIRRALNDIGAKASSVGSNTITLTTETGYSSYVDGILLGFIAGGTNTDAATLNVDGVGARAVRKGADVALDAGDIVTGMPCIVVYDASANSAAGAWILVNPTNDVALGDAITAALSELDLDAGDIPFSPAGGIEATNVQAAIEELDTEKAAKVQTFDEPVIIEFPEDGDYRILDRRLAGTIKRVTTRCAAGTCTVTVKINATPLGGSANSASTSEQSQTHSSANAWVIGDDWVITISDNNGCERLSINIEYERSLA